MQQWQTCCIKYIHHSHYFAPCQGSKAAARGEWLPEPITAESVGLKRVGIFHSQLHSHDSYIFIVQTQEWNMLLLQREKSNLNMNRWAPSQQTCQSNVHEREKLMALIPTNSGRSSAGTKYVCPTTQQQLSVGPFNTKCSSLLLTWLPEGQPPIWTGTLFQTLVVYFQNLCPHTS